MSEQDTIVCPDCGAAYAFTEEQQGKLLHCKCGRYLVAGGLNQKTPKTPASEPPAVPETSKIGVKTTAPVVPSEQDFGIKTVAPVTPPESKPQEHKSSQRPVAPQPGNSNQKTLRMAGIAVALLVLIAAGFFFLKPAKKAAPVVQQVPVSTPPAAVADPNAAASDAKPPCYGTPLRLPNGSPIAHSMLGQGMGKLEIENDTPSDVAVRLTGGGNLTIAWVYLQQGQKTSLTNIPLGAHKVLVASGSDWDPQHLTFKCNDVYTEFEKPLDYTDRREEDRTVYSAYKISLGKQKTVPATKEDFLRGYFGE